MRRPPSRPQRGTGALGPSQAQFAGCPFPEAFPYLMLDARNERVREPTRRLGITQFDPTIARAETTSADAARHPHRLSAPAYPQGRRSVAQRMPSVPWEIRSYPSKQGPLAHAAANSSAVGNAFCR